MNEQATVYITKPTAQTNATTTLANDTALTFNIGANETWLLRIDINGNGAAAADWKFAVTAPAGATCAISASDFEGATAQANLGCGVATGLIAASSADDPVWVSGVVANGNTAGVVTLQWSEFAVSGTNTVRAGSTLAAYRIRGADLAEVYYSTDHTVNE